MITEIGRADLAAALLDGPLADEVSSAGVFGFWSFPSKSGYHFCGSGKRSHRE
jgi:hypothetical protein